MDIYIDIETNAPTDWITLQGMDTIHCICVSIQGEEPHEVDVETLAKLLTRKPTLIGHNIHAFDIPALAKVYPELDFSEVQILDTLLLSRLVFPDLVTQDVGMGKDTGSHSLGAWGNRLGQPKSDYQGGWSDRSDEMVAYCLQDVRVTIKLHNHLNSKGSSDQAVQLEHKFAATIRRQEANGFRFDVDAARVLHSSLVQVKVDIEREMQELFPPKTIERYSTKTGKRLKDAIDVFNPGSRLQISERLKEKYGWVASQFTPDGRPMINEKILGAIDYPEAASLNRYLTNAKHLGMLAEGDNAWLKMEKEGRIHGRVITNGAVTGRCSHREPNMAQIPSGPTFRRMFLADPGWVLVGADASGLELRCLAHYLHRWDGGQYATVILEDDVHWVNAQSFGLVPRGTTQDKTDPTHKAARDTAKGGIYALIYGASDSKLGETLGVSRRDGAKARHSFYDAVPSYKKLVDAVSKSVDMVGILKGLDGRSLPIRSKHSAINTLLQSAGAVLMKQAVVTMATDLSGVEHKQVAMVHDEVQLTCPPNVATIVGETAVQAIVKSGDALGFKCRLDGEYRVGSSWAETH